MKAEKIFVRAKVNPLDRPNDVEVHYTHENGFKIIITPEGFYFKGESPKFSKPSHMEVLAQAIGDASHDYLKLKKDFEAKVKAMKDKLLVN